MRVLVTGGAGFIGHHMVRGLLAAGHQVAVLDDLSSGTLERLAPVRDRITFVRGDVVDAATVDAVIAGCEAVVHLAAIASVARSVEEPRRTEDVNVGGTIEVVQAAARHGVRRVVLASSSAIYGVPETLPCAEHQVPAPTSPYGVTKLAAEHYLHVLGALGGVETVALRYFNVFGPGQDPKSEYAAVIPKFATALLAGVAPTINGSGAITRDFVFIDDVVGANIAAMGRGAPSGLTCNIAGGQRQSLTQLYDAICAAAGRRIEPVVGPPRVGDIPDSVADISKAERELGFRVGVPFAAGIAATVDWYRSQARP